MIFIEKSVMGMRYTGRIGENKVFIAIVKWNWKFLTET